MQRNLKRAAQLAALGHEIIGLRRAAARHRPLARLHIVKRLMSLHGLPQKMGQILSLAELNDDVPVFTQLVETPPQMSAKQAFREIEGALGCSWRSRFRSLSTDAVGASLAQVHRGTLSDGRDVAVKIQYPGIADSLELDLKALGWLTTPVGGLRRGFDLAGYRREIGTMLRQELDYRHEAEMIGKFRAVASATPSLIVPEVVERLSGERILTMTWLDGACFAEVRRWPLAARARVANCILSLFLTSVFRDHLFHADPHPGNYRFRRSMEGATVGLLDFGCVKAIPADIASALYALISDAMARLLRNDPGRARARFEALGFSPQLLAPMQDRLPDLCGIVFEPFLKDEPFDMRMWNLGARVATALDDFRWSFRMAGPPSLIYFMRAYQGLVQYLSALDVPVNWHAAFRSVSPQPTRTFAALQTTDLVPPKSQALRIRVIRGGRVKAELSFPATAGENLSDLMPPKVERKLAERGVDVAEITRSLVSEGFPTGELFSLREGDDNFIVWLE